MDISGGLIATDGTVLVGYDSAGNPFGEPVLLVPVQGSVFDLTITSNNIAVLLYKCGFIATYLTGISLLQLGILWNLPRTHNCERYT